MTTIDSRPRPGSADADRITNLDAVRGVAVLLIPLMNVVSFGLPAAAYANLDAAGSSTPVDRAVGVMGELLVDQKGMGLFSLLFGAGVVLYLDRARRQGRRAVALSLWRNLLLAVIGLAHMLLWDGDVLMAYAACAPLVLLLQRFGPRVLTSVTVALLASAAVLALVVQSTVPESGAGLGSYWYVTDEPIGVPVGLWFLYDGGARALGMMVLGVALHRTGVIPGTRSATLYRRLAAGGFALGLPLAGLGVWVQHAAGYRPEVAVIGQVPNLVATVPMTLGYLGLVTLWNRRSDTWLHRRVRAVGRMALTNYLTQTVIGVSVLRFWLEFGSLGRARLALGVVAVWVLQLAWSAWWLRRFRYGPVEWLWRSATNRRLQPFRHRALSWPARDASPSSASGRGPGGCASRRWR